MNELISKIVAHKFSALLSIPPFYGTTNHQQHYDSKRAEHLSQHEHQPSAFSDCKQMKRRKKETMNSNETA